MCRKLRAWEHVSVIASKLKAIPAQDKKTVAKWYKKHLKKEARGGRGLGRCPCDPTRCEVMKKFKA